jgi:hypothetical protein
VLLLCVRLSLLCIPLLNLNLNLIKKIIKFVVVMTAVDRLMLHLGSRKRISRETRFLSVSLHDLQNDFRRTELHSWETRSYFSVEREPFAACSMREATARGCET